LIYELKVGEFKGAEAEEKSVAAGTGRVLKQIGDRRRPIGRLEGFAGNLIGFWVVGAGRLEVNQALRGGCIQEIFEGQNL
jgi:hypothetical protein